MPRLLALAALGLITFSPRSQAAPSLTPAPFAKGADVGWLPQMEATGYKFLNADGAPEDCLQILKDNGMDAIRLRVWVNPSASRTSGHCSKPEVVAMAVRAHKMGFRIMISFHYSDSWSDPDKQPKPAAWAAHPFPQLLTDLHDYTVDVLTALKTAGVTPEWVQVGNEIPNGMLWPDGDTAHWDQLAQLINKGYYAVKSVDPSIKVVVHLDQGNNAKKFRTFFDNFQQRGGKWDVIGMSYYPWWLHQDYKASIDDLGKNLIDMAARYKKEVMVVEVGGDSTLPDNTYDMLMAVQQKVRAVPDHKGLGVLYWEPEGAKSWSHYSLSCWGPDSKPTKALTAFKDSN